MGWHSNEVPKDLRGDTVCSEYLRAAVFKSTMEIVPSGPASTESIHPTRGGMRFPRLTSKGSSIPMMLWRSGSVATYSMRPLSVMCMWMPSTRPDSVLAPPVFSSIRTTKGLLASFGL